MFHSLKTKVLFAIVVITVATAGCMAFLFYRNTARTVEMNYGDNLYGRVQQTARSLDEQLKEIYYVCVESSCDESLIENAQLYGESPKVKYLYEMSEQLMEYKNRNPIIQSVYLFLPKEKVVVTSSDYQLFVKNYKGNRMTPSSNGTSPVLGNDPLSAFDRRFLSFEEAIEGESGVIGYVMVNVDERELFYRYLDEFQLEEINQVYLADGAGKMVSTENIEDIGSKALGLDPAYLVDYRDKKTISVCEKLPFSNYYFVAGANREVVLANLNTLKYQSFLIAAAFIIFSILPAYVASKRVDQPLKRLKSTMGQVKQGDLSSRVLVKSKDDIGVLSEDFNDMLDQLEDVLHNLIQEKLLKKDAELQSLQYQITPHFMYNTLNTIKMAAILNGDEYLGQLLGGFIELLQASINKKGAFLTVEEEVYILKNYVELQLFRYQNSFEVEYRVEKEAEYLYVPRLILQPLVENAILHGLDMKSDNCKIIVAAEKIGELLILTVEDNGKGMSEQQMEELFSGKKQKGRLSGIGVANIRDRLHLYYGEKGILHFTSDLQHGTRARIQIPAAEDGEEYVVK